MANSRIFKLLQTSFVLPAASGYDTACQLHVIAWDWRRSKLPLHLVVAIEPSIT
ncbi:hypothetical protein E2C01_063809 [Portunus trituberculatus]|uniref:Uncharacterized protein n=1 Tax=Portunus trituberculatus TaxID=210409 RepID=A0A5B7HBH3_PORTR|nr:hypothetical protein [Portunus trituberculatus]